jgi:hypothetical protein
MLQMLPIRIINYNPMKRLTKNIQIFSLLALFIAFLGCNEDDDSELPQVVAGFTHTINQSTGTVSFLNTSSDADSYVWDFGDDTSSTEINPIKTYGTGTFTIVLTAKNAAGSSSTFEDTIVIDIPLPVTLPITFDDVNVIYDATAFNGASFEIVDNPDPSGSNSTVSKVGEVTNAGFEFEGIFFNLGEPVNLETEKTVLANFWSNTPIDVLIKLENADGTFTENAITHGGTGWEEITFTFSSSESFSVLTLFVDAPGTTAGTFYIDDIRQTATVDNTPPVITLLGDAVITVIMGGTYDDPGATAVDNIDGDISNSIVVGGDVVDVNVIDTYTITYDVSDTSGNEADQVTRVVNVIDVPTGPITSAPIPPVRNPEDVLSIFGDTYTNILINDYDPDSGQSGHMMVDTGYDPGDGNLALAYLNFNFQLTDFGAPYDAAAMEFLHVDIWVTSDTSRQVKVSPINTGSGASEVQTVVPVIPGSWSSVDLPMSAFTGMTWDAVSQMLFNGQFNADGSANSDPFDIYLDNIYFYRGDGGGGGGGGGGGDPLALPFTFEEGVAPPFIAFDNGATVANISNPQPTGNSSARVLEFNKVLNSEWYSGFVFDDTLIPTPLVDLANGTTFTIKIWSPTAGANVRFQIEDNDSGGAGNPTANRDQIITTANEWVTLTFDFSIPDGTGDPGSIPDPSFTFKRIAIFPDFDPANQVPVNPGAIYYIDDIIQE